LVVLQWGLLLPVCELPWHCGHEMPGPHTVVDGAGGGGGDAAHADPATAMMYTAPPTASPTFVGDIRRPPSGLDRPRQP
jgi:hypothetical protein